MFFIETKKGEGSAGASGDAAATAGAKGEQTVFEKRLAEQKNKQAKAAKKAAQEQRKRRVAQGLSAEAKLGPVGAQEALEETERAYKAKVAGGGGGAAGKTVGLGTYNLDSLAKTFLELECLDLAGKPLANVRVVVRDSVGNPFDAKTDANGILRIDELAQGAAQVSFPDLTQDDTDAPPPPPAAKPAPKVEEAKKEAKKPEPKKPAPKKDLIPKGSAIRPPKKSKFISDEEKEILWFAKLEDTTIAELQPGDILLRKAYEPHPIKAAQKPFYGDYGTSCTVHAMLYSGAGKVIEASFSEKKLVEGDVPAHDLIVWRPKDKAAATSALDVAKWMLSTGKVEYSEENCFATLFHNNSFGPLGKGRAEQIRKRQLPSTEMMCSEFVSFCFQGRKTVDIQLDAMRVAPLELEDYLNANSTRFVFAGVLRKS